MLRSKHFTYINSFHRTAIVSGKCNYYPHYSDEESELGRADHICGLSKGSQSRERKTTGKLLLELKRGRAQGLGVIIIFLLLFNF